MSAPDRACPDYPNDCMHPWAHARTYAEVKATQQPDSPEAYPCTSGQCDRLVSASSHYCCAPCRVAWEATPHYEPHEHSESCDRRQSMRRSSLEIRRYDDPDPRFPDRFDNTHAIAWFNGDTPPRIV